MRMTPINEHPSSLDPTARLEASDRLNCWSIYSVRGGYVLIVDGMAAEGLFTSAAAARKAAEPAI